MNADSKTGMESDQPSGGGRAAKRHRSLVIVMGLAIALIGGVVVIGMIHTGDRAGTTTSDPSASASASAEATSSPSASAEATSSPSASASPTESASAVASASASPTETAIVLTCAEGGTCAVGDVGPGGGTIIYVNANGFTCGEALTGNCTTLEAGAISYGQLCSLAKPNVYGLARSMSSGEYMSKYSASKCQGGLLSSVLASTDGGQSDWFVGGVAEINQAVNQEALLGIDGLDLWSISQGNDSDMAETWFGITNVWQKGLSTYGKAYAIAMRTF